MSQLLEIKNWFLKAHGKKEVKKTQIPPSSLPTPLPRVSTLGSALWGLHLVFFFFTYVIMLQTGKQGDTYMA